MTTNAAPPRVPTPRLKAPPTSGTSSESVTAFNTRPGPLRPDASTTKTTAATAHGPRRAGRPGLSDPLSDKTTSFLIRRILCPQQLTDKERTTPAPIEELLPPLTSRNDVDLQLYALIAIILKEFVQNWYNKITPDETFVAEIIQIIAHCTRALEQRLRKVDLESLLFDELPELLDKHVEAYRVAHSTVAMPPTKTDPHQVYHSLYPLPFLSPVPRPDAPQTVDEQANNEMAYRQLLVRGVLAVLLPTEDLENECLTALVGQIFSELIIGGVIARKASEPWLIWEGLTILSRVIRQKVTAEPAEASDSRVPGRRLSTSYQHPGFSFHRLFGFLLQMAFAAFSLLRFMVATITTSHSLPSRRRSTVQRDESTHHKGDEETMDASSAGNTTSEPTKVPVVAFRLWPALSNLIEMDVRMPWLCGALSMLQWIAMTGPGQVAGLDGVLDRLSSHYLRRYVLDPSHLPPLLRSLRGALFPNNTLGSPTLFAPSSDAELLALRRKCANALWALVPRGVGRLFFGARAHIGSGSSEPLHTEPRSGPTNGHGDANALLAPTTGLGPAQAVQGYQNTTNYAQQRQGGSNSSESKPGRGRRPDDRRLPLHHEDGDARILAEIETGVLDVFGDAYCNKHLMYGALELVLVRLMPELADKGVLELWEERLS